MFSFQKDSFSFRDKKYEQEQSLDIFLSSFVP